jgi:hypothetical protein
MQLPYPYLVFLAEETAPRTAKTAFGLRDWAPGKCLAEWSLPACGLTLELPTRAPPRRTPWPEPLT